MSPATNPTRPPRPDHYDSQLANERMTRHCPRWRDALAPERRINVSLKSSRMVLRIWLALAGVVRVGDWHCAQHGLDFTPSRVPFLHSPRLRNSCFPLTRVSSLSATRAGDDIVKSCRQIGAPRLRDRAYAHVVWSQSLHFSLKFSWPEKVVE